LTQMTYGFSRDDAGKFLNAYYDKKIMENDPFAKLDKEGVGRLMKMAVDMGKQSNDSLHIGICGEHGGDPSSVEFCNKIGLDYVSCSPYRVPIARLSAAQAAISEKNADASEKSTKKSVVDDETIQKLKEAAEKAQALARDLAETSADVAKAGLAGLKAGIEQAKKAYQESRKN
ncbi:MAG TPA: pyruvate, phosphate dikinase, partial [Lachnospiraceae bacterium]|nr:pyruvate, phosphate dikinase [Lachnospiraceae bacterium]